MKKYIIHLPNGASPIFIDAARVDFDSNPPGTFDFFDENDKLIAMFIATNIVGWRLIRD